MKISAMMLGCATLALAGCQPNPRTTMDLLKSGNGGVCIASDVEDTLRRLIHPDKGGESYTISFADSSLEAFDASVSRATCNTALTVDGPHGPMIERTMLDYVITPAAQNPATFLVSGPTEPIRQRLQELIDEAASASAEEATTRQSNEAQGALIKPGWLIGRWVQEEQGSRACVEGPYDDYGRGQRYTSASIQGRWKLEEQALTIIGPSASVLLTITDAAMDNFTAAGSDGATDYRRCTREDMQGATGPASSKLTDHAQQTENAAGPLVD